MRYVAIQFVLLLLLFAGYRLSDGPTLYQPSSVTAAVADLLKLASVVLMLAATLTMGRNLRAQPEPSTTGPLVTHGVYRHLRHPIYTGIVFLSFGFLVSKPNATMAAGVLALTAFLIVKARYEEKLLLARHPEYEQYKSCTYGVVPLMRGR